MSTRLSIRFSIYIIAIFALSAFGQSVYKGTIGKAAVEFVIENVFPNNEIAYGSYMYSKYNEPIKLDGVVKNGKLIFFELGKKNDTIATISFLNYNAQESLYATWENLSNGIKIPIKLHKRNEFTFNDNDSEWCCREILQVASLRDYYIKTVAGVIDSQIKIEGINIYEKKSGRLFQSIRDTADWENEQTNLPKSRNVELNDYSFDGAVDISLFGTIYSGTNSSRHYIIWNSKENKFCSKVNECINCTFNNATKEIAADYWHPNGEVTVTKYKFGNCKLILLIEKGQ